MSKRAHNDPLSPGTAIAFYRSAVYAPEGPQRYIPYWHLRQEPQASLVLPEPNEDSLMQQFVISGLILCEDALQCFQSFADNLRKLCSCEFMRNGPGELKKLRGKKLVFKPAVDAAALGSFAAIFRRLFGAEEPGSCLKAALTLVMTLLDSTALRVLPDGTGLDECRRILQEKPRLTSLVMHSIWNHGRLPAYREVQFDLYLLRMKPALVPFIFAECLRNDPRVHTVKQVWDAILECLDGLEMELAKSQKWLNSAKEGYGKWIEQFKGGVQTVGEMQDDSGHLLEFLRNGLRLVERPLSGYENLLSSKPEYLAFGSPKEWPFSPGRLIEMFLADGYVERLGESNPKLSAAFRTDGGDDEVVLVWLFMNALWAASREMVRSGKLILRFWSRYCLQHGINPAAAP